MKRKQLLHFSYMAVISIFLLSCGNNTKKVVTLDLGNMDTSVEPTEDFYSYVNGKWQETTEMPADQGRWGSFGELRKNNSETVLAILEKAAKDKSYVEGSDQRKAADFYAVGMDSVLAEKRGAKPIQPWFEKVESIENIAQLQNVLIKLHILGFSGFYGAGISPDLMQSDINTLYLGAGGFGLPNRDYYTKDDSASVQLRAKYRTHIARMLNISHEEKRDYSKEAQAIYDIEYKLAFASLTPIQRRDLRLIYNKMSLDNLSEIAPSVDWKGYFEGQGIVNADTVIVTQPKVIKVVEEIFNEEDIENIKWYLKWHIIDRAASYLNAEIVQANFDFFGKELNGTEEMKPRWERVLGNTNRSLGEALGKLYVDEVFPPEAKAEAKEMVEYILLAFGDRIDALEWMSDETKKAAHVKLDKFTVKIGYPDKWKDYSSLIVDKEGDSYSYFGNVLHASRFYHEENIAKNGKPVDKEEWHMNPQDVNAYYSPLNNEIVFPAAILQPPFYYYQADAAINFGAIGAVIGHEATHGFDDMGSRFDENGNMKNWWTEEDKTQFEKHTEKLVAQFDAYEPLEGLNIQGKLTLGENIADLGGVNVAYDGMQKYYETHEKPADVDGFTQEQRFFMSWATVWRTKYRDEALRTHIQTGPHSPGMYRATAPLENVDAFHAAFATKEGNAMWKPEGERIKIW